MQIRGLENVDLHPLRVGSTIYTLIPKPESPLLPARGGKSYFEVSDQHTMRPNPEPETQLILSGGDKCHFEYSTRKASNMGSAGTRGRWGTPTMALRICSAMVGDPHRLLPPSHVNQRGGHR